MQGTRQTANYKLQHIDNSVQPATGFVAENVKQEIKNRGTATK